MKSDSHPSREARTPRDPRPGDVGLTNEARPGLGSPVAAKSRPPTKSAATREDREPQGRNRPIERPAPSEQESSDTRARELERDCGVSGHAAGD